MSFEVPSTIDVRIARKDANMSQGELADKAGVSQVTISKIERDEMDPKLSTMQSIADALE